MEAKKIRDITDFWLISDWKIVGNGLSKKMEAEWIYTIQLAFLI